MVDNCPGNETVASCLLTSVFLLTPLPGYNLYISLLQKSATPALLHGSLSLRNLVGIPK